MNVPPVAATVDLQVHSTASDGVVTPGAVATAAAAAGLSAFALTDHDSVAGIAEATVVADPLGVRVIPGVELSITDAEREVHLLGLHVEPAGALETALAEFRTQREERAAKIVAMLRGLGIEVTVADVAFQAGNGAVGRPHIARAIIAAGVCKDFREVFDRFLGAGRPAFVPKPKLGARAAIDLVHAAGGLAIWAHPGPEGRRERLEMLIAAGLDGVEVLHPGHSGDDTRRLLALCEHFALVASGGSDWHGETTGSRVLGAMRVPATWLARQDERVAARRAAGVS